LVEKVNVRIIKPPIKRVTSGKIFKPSRAYLHKNLFQLVFLFTMIWVLVMIGFVSLSYLLAYTEPSKYQSAPAIIATWFRPLNTWTLGLNLIWLIPSLLFTPYYYRSIEYSVKAESGETMPEIYVKKGIVTVTRKHVPFRAITNISSNIGPFDRLFGIGSVHIETAGFSGSSQTGPEEKIEGIVFHEEVRDFILKELRKFRTPFVMGTEVVRPEEEPVPRGPGLDDEMLITLREIRDLLANKGDPQ
jgi:membrane protein YdbS with pleckstrin-like domain